MRKVLQEILEKNPRFHHLTPLKTKHIAHWCRCHGYTPPDPESLRSEGDSIEDVLTQIDSEPGKCQGRLRASPQQRGFSMLHALISQPPQFLGLISPSSFQVLCPSAEVKGPEDSRSCLGKQEPLLTSGRVSHLPPRTPPTELLVPKCPKCCVPARHVPAHGMHQTHTFCSGAPPPQHHFSLEDFPDHFLSSR